MLPGKRSSDPVRTTNVDIAGAQSTRINCVGAASRRDYPNQPGNDKVPTRSAT